MQRWELQAGPHSVHVRALGAGSPVLMLHGSGSSGMQWLPLARQLAEDHYCLFPDLLGYHRSTPISSDVTVTFRDDLDALEVLLSQLEEDVVLVGHSYGGFLALQLAALSEMRDRIRAVAVFEPVAFSILLAADGLFRTLAERAAFFDLSRGLEGFLRGFVEFWGGNGAFDALPPERRSYMLATAHKLYCEVRSLSEDVTSGSDYARIRVPVLVMHGDQSPAAAQRVAKRLGDVLERVEVCAFDGVGHMGPLTHKELVNERIERFIIERFMTENANA